MDQIKVVCSKSYEVGLKIEDEDDDDCLGLKEVEKRVRVQWVDTSPTNLLLD